MTEALKKMKYRYLVLGSIITFIIALIFCKLLDMSNYISASISVTLALYGFPIVWILYKFNKFETSIRVWLSAVKFKITEIITSVVFSQLLGVGILFLLTAVVTLILPMRGESESIVSTTNWIEVFISTCILAPFCEEIIFRGFIFNKLLSKHSPVIATIICSVIFGAMHLTSGIAPTIIGVVLCIIYMKYKSLIPCMVIHCFNNVSILTLKYLTFGNMEPTSEVRQPDTIVLFIFSAVLIMIGLFWLINFIKKNWHYSAEFANENYIESTVITSDK